MECVAATTLASAAIIFVIAPFGRIVVASVVATMPVSVVTESRTAARRSINVESAGA